MQNNYGVGPVFGPSKRKLQYWNFLPTRILNSKEAILTESPSIFSYLFNQELWPF